MKGDTKMSKVIITYKAFGDDLRNGRVVSSVEFEGITVWADDHIAFCEKIFADTNTYTGWVWDIVEPLLPLNRTHTAVSVGDEIEIDGKVYRCENVGFIELVKSYNHKEGK